MITTIPATPTKRFAVIDGLRGVAILWVTLVHLPGPWLSPDYEIVPWTLGSWIRSGAFGVPLFFALSGFCLFYPMIKDGTFKLNLKNFWMRRLLRIYPSYLISVCILSAIWYHQTRDVNWLFHVGTHLTFIYPYFQSALHSINGPWWSLGIEDQYYIVLPIIAYLMYKRFISALIGLVAVSVIWCAFLSSKTDQDNVRYLMEMLPAMLPQFLVGMIAAWIYAKQYQFGKADIACLWIMGLFGILISPHLYTWFYPTRYPITATSVYVLSSPCWGCLILAALSSPKSIGSRILSSNIMVWLGTISYSLYLYNMIDRPIMKVLLPNVPQYTFAYAAIALPIVLSIGALGYYAIESPFMRLRERMIAKSQAEPKNHHAQVDRRQSRTRQSVPVERPQEA